MTASWRTIRVFISSTFRDMHSERDWLVKRVFPALRERLEPHRIHLVDIDLRWGVTKEQADNDQALDVCLDQIDECRPYFLGILGERYGWVSDRLPERTAGKYGWIRQQTGKSITELEILYGVLNDPRMRRHALFCFRDPRILASLPGEMLPVFAEFPTEDERGSLPPREARGRALDRRRRLERLKQTLRDAGLPTPPFEDYPCRFAGMRINWPLARQELNEADRRTLERGARDGLIDAREYASLSDRLRQVVNRFGAVQLAGLEAFGEFVLETLWDAIRTEYALEQEISLAPPAEGSPLADEESHHQRFLESRVRVYVGRNSLRNEIAHYADGDEPHACLVTGRSGEGKSAALARFVRTYRRARPRALLVPHVVGASPASTSLRQLLHRFCSILKEQFAFEGSVPPDTNSLVTAFREFVERVPEGRRVVFVIDALNQLDEADGAQDLHWLPARLPPHVKLIASCIDDPGRDEKVLRAFVRRPCRRIEIEPLSDGERRGIVRAVPSISAKTLDDAQVDLLLANPATRNPLFLLVTLEELRGFGSFEQLNRRIEAFPREGDAVTAVFRQVIERLEDEFDRAIVRDLLSLLASARRGLSDRELLDLLEGAGVDVASSRSDLFPVLRQLRPYLQHRGPLRDFFHRNLHKAVREMYLASDALRSSAHSRLASYFQQQDDFLESLEEQRARSRRLPPTPRPANVRKVDELPWQLLEVAKFSGRADPASPHWDAVASLFLQLHFLEAKAEART
jgi:hypothetical protein